MSTTSNIEWTDKTWNPVVGCKMVSAGCAHCYAETMSNRLAAMAKADVKAGRNPGKKSHYLDVMTHDGKFNGAVRFVREAIAEPLNWRKPARVFVNSMSDLFHEGVPFEYIDQIFAVMALCPQHTFQILTKRPERLAEYTRECATPDRWWKAAVDAGIPVKGSVYDLDICNPLPNVWLGTSVENQEQANKRIPHLLKCPAAVRFLSCEPLLGPIDFDAINIVAAPGFFGSPLQWYHRGLSHKEAGIEYPTVSWVIVGGESGSDRVCNVQWVRSIVEQCKAAGVAAFVKQLGSNPVEPKVTGARDGTLPIMEAGWPDGTKILTYIDTATAMWLPGEVVLKDRKGGDMSEWPEDLRVRELPIRVPS